MNTVGNKHHKCEECRMRAYAEKRPKSLIARFWRWHTGWCPGWKAYQRSLVDRTQAPGN